MTNLIHQMFRALLWLPAWLKVFIALVLVGEFVVITHWPRTTAQQPLLLESKAAPPPQTPVKQFDFSEPDKADQAKATALQSALSKRMERMIIADPQVQPNGTISANGQTIYLYGLKPFDSKQLCTKSSGERWACGLHAYADLRNSVAHKMIICDPKSIAPNGVVAACRLGQTDIAAMLVHDGLAEVAQSVTDPPLLNAQALAKSRRVGIWDR